MDAVESKPEQVLTPRQQREVEYHRIRAQQVPVLESKFSWDVLNRPTRRWWNAYWYMYGQLVRMDLKGKRVLVVGCGFGHDAVRLSRLGAEVHAFDISPESLSIARKVAQREGLDPSFAEMPAESLTYPDGVFDVILAVDILHHVDIPHTMGEIRRVAKPGATLVVNEIYSHSWTDAVRHSSLVEKLLYQRMQPWVYGHKEPYITEDERKLQESDVCEVAKHLHRISSCKYFNFVVTRLVSDRSDVLAIIDRILLMVLKSFGRFLAGRILLQGLIGK